MNIQTLGPEEILQISDPAARLTAFIVIDSTRLGPAHGGVRIRSYESEREAILDAIRLASAMTMKAALAGIPCGGGKIVVIDRPGLRRGPAMRLIGKALNDLGGRYFAGPDYGITKADLAALSRVTRHVAFDRAGASEDLADATARGVIAAARAALTFAATRAASTSAVARPVFGPTRLGRSRSGAEHLSASRLQGALEGATAAVQGLGAVGSAIVRRLREAGASVVAADPDTTAARRGAALGARIVPPGRLSSLCADLFVPAAVGGTIDERFAAGCRVRVVCGPANNMLASVDVEEQLRRRGVIFVPDIAASAGALIAGSLRHLGKMDDPGPVIDRIGPRVGRLLREAERTGQIASELALLTAARRLRRGRQ